ncbi:MAG: TonB-dependent receptor, partial [Opitutaceae bacterium]|nr:TonB-dependent receptor [Opitutaceae bacterium]
MNFLLSDSASSRLCPALGLLLTFSATSAFSQSTPPAGRPEDDAVRLPAFTIVSEDETGYAATNSISATKVATELKNMPVSIDVLTEQLFKDYGLTEVYDIVGLSAGVSSTQRAATGNLESYTIRGFTTFFSARNGSTNFRSFDSANVSRVEVVNGPASVLYGQLDPGGVANTVTKQPSAKRSSNVKLDIGSWEYYRAEIGTTGPLNRSGTLTYRVDASYLDRSGYRDFDDQTKRFIAPVIRWQPRRGTSLTLDMEYVDMDLTGLANWPRYNRRITAPFDVKFADMIPLTWNGQGPGLGTHTGNQIYTATFEHALTDSILIRNVAGVTSFHRNSWEAGATAINILATTPAGQLPYSRSLSGNYANGRSFANTLNIAARFDFSKRHYTRVVAGWEYVASRNDSDSRVSGIANGVGVATPANWDLANPATWDRTVPRLADARISAYSGTRFWEDKFYLVDALALFDERLMVLAGLNYSKIENVSANYLANTRLRIERDRITPQGGAVFRVTKALGLYANCSESFRQITTLRTNADRSLTPFDPLIAKGLDYGVKFDFGDGRYSGQATVFDTKNINGRQSFSATDAIGAYTYETQVGENRAKGFELRLSANVTKNFQLVGGYTQTHSYISKNPSNPAIVGRAAIRSPTHSATLTTSYRFTQGRLKGFSTGANVSYRGEAKAFETNDAYPFLLDPRIVVNARVGYATKVFGKPATYNFNITNLLDERYFPSSISQADPTSYRLS